MVVRVKQLGVAESSRHRQPTHDPNRNQDQSLQTKIQFPHALSVFVIETQRQRPFEQDRYLCNRCNRSSLAETSSAHEG